MREIIEGDVLDQYQLTELLARSGMASIFKAIDKTSGKTVAVKVPHLQYESDIAFFERFKREEQIGQKLDHPHIVRVLTPEQKSRMYMVMEFAEGKSLRAIVKERKRLPPSEALDLARQVCAALVYLHAHGIVHRDLKPDNILVDASGQIKLVDFGIALDEEARRLTWFGLTPPVGTPDYMAPEQVRGRRGDVRTDIYALGILLYELMTGGLPYSGANVHAIMRMKLNEEPRPPHEVFSGIDPHIEEIILRAIERSPRERYASAQEMCTDLEDPSRVALRDRAAERANRPLLARIRFPRRLVFPVSLVLVMGTLLVLNWMMGHSAPKRPPPGLGHASPAPDHASPALERGPSTPEQAPSALDRPTASSQGPAGSP